MHADFKMHAKLKVGNFESIVIVFVKVKENKWKKLPQFCIILRTKIRAALELRVRMELFGGSC